MNKKEMIQVLLKADQMLNVYAMGDSMYPVIHQNDELIVGGADKYGIGDIIVFQYENELLVHRIIKISDTVYYCKGDNAFRLERVKESDVIGKVCKIYRAGKHIQIKERDSQFVELSFKIYGLYLRNMFNKDIVKETQIYKDYYNKYLREECL